MSSCSECPICQRAVEERGLDEEDREALEAWHRRWH